jgi:hypothetical protein
MSRINSLLAELSKAPPAQIDPTVSLRLKRLIGCSDEVVLTELAIILDDCVALALILP